MSEENKKKDKMKKMWIAIGILVILVVGLAVYILVDKYNQKKREQELGIFQQGVRYGYQQAILKIVQQAVSCQQVPLYVGNQTLNVIAVKCLGQGGEQNAKA